MVGQEEQSRNKGAYLPFFDAVPRSWSVYTLLFFGVFLILLCSLLFDVRTLPSTFLLHATNQLGAFRGHAGKNFVHLNGVDERTMRKEVNKTSARTSGEEIMKDFTTDDANCDYSTGQWVYDESYPLYKSDTCPFVDEGFRCIENGRPSDKYQKYRWQPFGCTIPRFDPIYMLENLRGRRLAFVGDSLGRNEWESLLCMLSDTVTNKSRIYEIHGEPITKHKGFLSFKFEEYNCTVEYYRSTNLVEQSRAPSYSSVRVNSTFKLDRIDHFARKWRDADILIFNSGHWWTDEKTFKKGNYFQLKDEIRMEMKVEDAFRIAIRTIAMYLDENIDSNRTQVFWRGYAPVHFKDGTWETEGTCVDSEPSNITSYQEPWYKYNEIIWEETQKYKKTPMIFLNITFASDHRADGHPSNYSTSSSSNSSTSDCSHWCLPGVPDTWNEFLYAALLNTSQWPWAEKHK
ncbi:hypothetical protein R1flu_026267 [Riccia fluitans]|uniref:Trichome birefringence-like N-terminal domain-containing protein n=1 Tax=Riccia fluitans TaxID=41844 RepID=A0ABD1XG20_9MARC